MWLIDHLVLVLCACLFCCLLSCGRWWLARVAQNVVCVWMRGTILCVFSALEVTWSGCVCARGVLGRLVADMCAFVYFKLLEVAFSSICGCCVVIVRVVIVGLLIWQIQSQQGSPPNWPRMITQVRNNKHIWVAKFVCLNCGSVVSAVIGWLCGWHGEVSSRWLVGCVDDMAKCLHGDGDLTVMFHVCCLNMLDATWCDVISGCTGSSVIC